MNRLVLIGNGFDLHHGLKTSYKNFLTDYKQTFTDIFLKNDEYCDELIEIKYSIHYNKVKIDKLCEEKKSLAKLTYLVDNHFVIMTYKSKFLSTLFEKVDLENWVDIENEYFNALCNCKDVNNSYDNSLVKELNNQFEVLKQKIAIYLNNLYSSTSSRSGSRYNSIFGDDIVKNEIVVENKLKSDEKPILLYILNFNYTNTILHYEEDLKQHIQTKINFIHGELDCYPNAPNPIIFGFGDEYDKRYQEFEEHHNNELFKHIKSFDYFKTQNYHDLIRFISGDEFQTYIYGHSCGLSDRTMLKQIFEHENCKSIKIFHYNRPDKTNDYTDKTYEIARHFSDKALMRKKIIPFNKDHCM